MISWARLNLTLKDFTKFGCGRTERALHTERSTGLIQLYDGTSVTGKDPITVARPDINSLLNYRARTGHGKSRKLWHLGISFSRTGKSWNLIVIPEKSWNIKAMLSGSFTAVCLFLQDPSKFVFCRFAKCVDKHCQWLAIAHCIWPAGWPVYCTFFSTYHWEKQFYGFFIVF